jgi:lysozyme family protein
MADFNEAVKITLSFEGGYTEYENDPGGPTNFGITQSDMPGVDMRTITQQQAIDYYQEHYWKPLYSQIENQAVANKLFDMGVNLGVGTAIKMLQEVIGVPVDGSFGPNTLAATNEAGEELLPAYKARLVKHYQAVVATDPEDAEFLVGWLRRANS